MFDLLRVGYNFRILGKNVCILYELFLMLFHVRILSDNEYQVVLFEWNLVISRIGYLIRKLSDIGPEEKNLFLHWKNQIYRKYSHHLIGSTVENAVKAEASRGKWLGEMKSPN